MRNNKILSLFILLFALSLTAQTRFKVMFQNMLNYSNSTISKQKTPFVKNILEEIQPDIFMVCEVVNKTASDYLFNSAVLPYNGQFNLADFKYSQSPASGLHQMVYYDTSKFVLENTKVIPTGTRDINHYTFKAKTENSDTNPVRIEVFVTHLKASRGSSNRLKRKNSIDKFINALSDLPSDSYVLFAGDFNFYTSNEEGYQSLIKNDNPIVMVDPINRPCPAFPNDGVDYYENYNATYFWNNYSFKDVHTQSTRTGSVSVIDDSGSSGGMDDRFDFIMMSQNFTSNNTLSYVEGSYKAVGNNGNCYNSFVSNINCTGEFSQSLREAVLETSDHLPVVMEVETNQNLLSNNSIVSNVKLRNGNVITDELFVSFKKANVAKVYVYNQLGQILLTKSTTNRKEIRLQLSQLKKGLYFLRTNVHESALKFIKQ